MGFELGERLKVEQEAICEELPPSSSLAALPS